jgi:hypothetical protein
MTGTYTKQTNPTQTGGASGQTTKSPCGCGCGQPQPCDPPCCTDVCFERPSYFCGHLLTDDDLTTGQRYTREKNKLYHRALHGSGIVCGLGMRRDLDCPNNILIGEGFAIDACGNDLVVCQQQSFNVISALNQKGYLTAQTPDPCQDDPNQDCSMTQCFWIAARYGEEPSDFESPLQSACSPGPASCLPTRIQETVKFDVLDSPPEHRSALEQLIARFECCFRILTEGNFANTVKANREPLKALIDGSDGRIGANYFNIFCQLKAYFLQHIRRSPDPYDALLEDKVQLLTPPGQTELEREANWRAIAEKSFCGLFGAVWSYISNCMYSAMVFPCPAPKCGGEVILGTVEIKDGKLARICHCDRPYVWSAANFWQVLVAYLVETKTCEQSVDTLGNAANLPGGKLPEAGHCCPEADLNCSKFLTLYLLDPKSPQTAVLDTLRLMTGLTSAAKTAFNFMDPNVVPPAVFRNLNLADSQILAPAVGLKLQVADDAQLQTPASPFEAVMARMLARPGDTVTATVTNDKVMPVTFSNATMAAAATAIRAQVADTQKAVAAATTQIDQISASAAKVADLQAATAQIANTQQAVTAVTAQVQQISASAAKVTDLQAAQAQIQQLTLALQARDTTLATLNDQLTSLASRVAVIEKPIAPAAPAAGQGD